MWSKGNFTPRYSSFEMKTWKIPLTHDFLFECNQLLGSLNLRNPSILNTDEESRDTAFRKSCRVVFDPNISLENFYR